MSACENPARTQPRDLTKVATLAGINREFGEPFGIAYKDGLAYVSDGQNGKILTISSTGAIATFATGLDTPSGIVFDKKGNLLVADSGSDSIRKVDGVGKVTLVAGTDHKPGYVDGTAETAQFRGPIGSEGRSESQPRTMEAFM